MGSKTGTANPNLRVDNLLSLPYKPALATCLTPVVNADAQKQTKTLQEQLSKVEASSAAEVQRLQQAENKLNEDLKQARLDIRQVLILCCILLPSTASL